MKGFLWALEAAIAVALAIVAVHRLANPIPAGERFIARATIEQIPVFIPRGMRAVAVPANEVVGSGGFVLPGMHVDVLISGTPPDGMGGLGTQARTLLQNVEVLSAGHHFRHDAEGKPVAVQVVNLLVTPEQAEQLSVASHQTTIQLVLRNPLDREVPKPPLFPADVPPLLPPANNEAPHVMEIVVGSKALR